MLTIGVEEELQIIDGTTRALTDGVDLLLPTARPHLSDRVMTEIHTSQIETATPICATLDEVRHAIVAARRVLIDSAAQHGQRIVAAGTPVLAHWAEQRVTPQPRYQKLLDDYQLLVREQMIFACHVHITLPDDIDGIAVLNRVRPWLAVLLALSANSPFWQGTDTGYASFRGQHWHRWPLSGPPPHFASTAEYDALVAQLVQTGIIEDATKLYWDARIHPRYHTLECRVCDVSLSVDETILLTGLIRGLVAACVRHARDGTPYLQPHLTLLRVAHWRAARFGISDTLLDPESGTLLPAKQVITNFLAFIAPDLQAHGDTATVHDLLKYTFTYGNGAVRQLAYADIFGDLTAVVDALADETARFG